MDKTKEKFIKSAIEWIKNIDNMMDKLRLQREELVAELQNTCPHPNIEDLTKESGYDRDNGYGKWWKEPYYKCKQCKAEDRGYNRLKHERKERLNDD